MLKLTLSVMLLLSACGKVSTSERINLCDQLPSVSEKDTDQTIVEVDNFNAKYKAAYCGGVNA